VQRKQARSREGELSWPRVQCQDRPIMSNRSARKPTARVPRQRCGRWSNSPLPEPQNQKGLPRPLGSRRLQRVLRRRGQARRPGRRAHRDDNALHIAEAMIILPDHAGRAAAIKKALAEKGYQMSYPSIRHGLGQLRARCEASVACQQRCRRRCSSARFRFNGEPATEPL